MLWESGDTATGTALGDSSHFMASCAVVTPFMHPGSATSNKCHASSNRCLTKLNSSSFLLLVVAPFVAMPGAPSSVLAPSKARSL